MSKAHNHTIKHDVPEFDSTFDLHNHIISLVGKHYGKREAAYLKDMWDNGYSYSQMVKKFPWLKSKANISSRILRNEK